MDNTIQKYTVTLGEGTVEINGTKITFKSRKRGTGVKMNRRYER
jgi:uncharacterized Zn-binding protein involved in type VI secretion